MTDSGQIIHVNNTKVSMVDGIMIDLLMGDSGAYCHYCDISRIDANLLSNILKENMNTTKTYESIKATWDALEDGDISYNDSLRHGQCHAPNLM